MNIQDIEKLYGSGKLNDSNDEKGAGGYWDLAGELTDLAMSGSTGEGVAEDVLAEQLQTGFYAVLQKVLVRGELYE